MTFRYTDSATHERKVCPLTASEFMRRYLQHVLPRGQHRVRYFGWMHPAARARRAIVETLLAVVIIVHAKGRCAATVAPSLPALRELRPRARGLFTARSAGLRPMSRRSPPSLLPSPTRSWARSGGACPLSPEKPYGLCLAARNAWHFLANRPVTSAHRILSAIAPALPSRSAPPAAKLQSA